jgi:opacity protein-like surface antigen
MKLAELIAIAAIASILTQTSVFAQENPPAIIPVPEKTPATEKPKSDSDKFPATEKTNSTPAPEQKYSIGPAIQFGVGTSFGITGKFSVSDQISIRPMVLFGYKPSVSRSNINQILLKGGIAANGLSTDVVQAQIDTVAGQQVITDVLNNTGTGTAYGLTVSYDFKSSDSKIVGYIGPKLLFASASGSGNNGNDFTTNTNETNIGLTIGADYAISPDVTAGLNATYNVLRSGTTSVTSSGKTFSDSISGGNFNVGMNVSYNF